jgi:hypothetical protein
MLPLFVKFLSDLSQDFIAKNVSKVTITAANSTHIITARQKPYRSSPPNDPDTVVTLVIKLDGVRLLIFK